MTEQPSDQPTAPDPNADDPGPLRSDVLRELQARGLYSMSTDLRALDDALAGGTITAYCGFDPTAPSLHFGNLVQLIVLRHLQRAGHRVICLVGGSTGLIGDPRPTSERVLKTKEQTAQWVAGIQQQVRPFLAFDGENPAVMVNNLDWTAPMSALDFLREVGKHFRVGPMLRKDAVAARLNSDEGISYTEFSYQILQGLDFLHLFREYGCTLQTGGQDQWGNLTAGVDLIHKAEGKSVHLLATPLLTDSKGEKFGKSAGNAIWLSAELTSPYAFYQYWLNVDDASVVQLLKVFTDRTGAEIAELEQAVAERPQARQAQRVLAQDVTTLVHGDAATESAIEASGALFGRGELSVVDEPTLRAVLKEAGLQQVVEPGTIVDLLVAAGLATSLSEARRNIAAGGVNVNNQRVSEPDWRPTAADLLHGRYLVVRRGKKAVAGIEVTGQPGNDADPA